MSNEAHGDIRWELAGIARPAADHHDVPDHRHSLDRRIRSRGRSHSLATSGSSQSLADPPAGCRSPAVRRGARQPHASCVDGDTSPGACRCCRNSRARRSRNCGSICSSNRSAENDGDRLANLELPVPVCARQPPTPVEDLPRLIGRYDLSVNIELDKSGGLTAALDFAQAARRRPACGLRCCMVGGSLAMAPAMVLATAVRDRGPRRAAAAGGGTGRTGIDYRDGVMSLPSRKLWADSAPFPADCLLRAGEIALGRVDQLLLRRLMLLVERRHPAHHAEGASPPRRARTLGAARQDLVEMITR